MAGRTCWMTRSGIPRASVTVSEWRQQQNNNKAANSCRWLRALVGRSASSCHGARWRRERRRRLQEPGGLHHSPRRWRVAEKHWWTGKRRWRLAPPLRRRTSCSGESHDAAVVFPSHVSFKCLYVGLFLQNPHCSAWLLRKILISSACLLILHISLYL